MIPTTGSRRILQERCEKGTGSSRKTPEITGTWKQYSHRKMTRFFPVDSCQLPVPEIVGKISGQNTASTKSSELSGTGSFQAGLFDLGNYNKYE
jgi:hypothetical protein